MHTSKFVIKNSKLFNLPLRGNLSLNKETLYRLAM